MTEKGTLVPKAVRLRTPREVLTVMETAAAGAIEGNMPTTTVRLLTRIGAQSLRALDLQRKLDVAAKRHAEEARAKALESEDGADLAEPTFEERVMAFRAAEAKELASHPSRRGESP